MDPKTPKPQNPKTPTNFFENFKFVVLTSLENSKASKFLIALIQIPSGDKIKLAIVTLNQLVWNSIQNSFSMKAGSICCFDT